MLDTQNTSSVLTKKFELAFGFAQGERWYGSIVCDEGELNERVRSGTFEGELRLISKRTLPRRKVRVNFENQEITLLDGNMDGTDASITIPYTASGSLGFQLLVSTWCCNIERVTEPLSLNRVIMTGGVMDCCQSSGVQGGCAIRHTEFQLPSL
jgi:hypothetical protein